MENSLSAASDLASHEASTVGAKRVRLDFTFNVGTVIQIIVLIISVTLAYAAFDRRETLLEMRFDAVDKTVQQVDRQTNRVEHYLSSKDPDYWRPTHENGDPDVQ